MPRLCGVVLGLFFVRGAVRGVGLFLVRFAGHSMSKAFLMLCAVLVGGIFCRFILLRSCSSS